MQCRIDMPRIDTRLLAFCLLASAACSSLATTPQPVPVLQLSGDDFPALVTHQPAHDEDGVLLPLACEQIRGKRIDELDPLWKQAVERIHLDCDDLKQETAGFDMVATVATGFLRPGLVEFAGLPVAEVRLMDSELWGDHEYILDRPYADIREALERFVESHCRASQDNAPQDNLQALPHNTCKLTETDEGLYLEAGPLGGIWIHPDHDDPRRTVYAEVWAD
ncbi:MAG: hypothetical protein ACREO7_03500 [Pseudoxanthomonas sp.]